MSMRVQSVTGFTLRGWHVLAGMLLFFGIIVAVNVLFAFAAVGTFPGEDVPHSYLQGLDYNQTLAERRVQAASGWRAIASLRPSSDGALLEVDLRSRDGEGIGGARIAAQMRWPADMRRDRSLNFTALGEGRYVAHLGALPPGDWDLRARAVRGSASLDFEADLTWPTAS
jgi:nitrogen fixation protein FixH